MTKETTCDACNGSGQISFFQGVSRFLITWEECPACGGLGVIPGSDEEADQQDKRSKGSKKKRS